MIKNMPKKSATQLSQLNMAELQLNDATTDKINDLVDTDNIDNKMDVIEM